MKVFEDLRPGRGLAWLTLFCWTSLVWINYWPSFAFPPGTAVGTFLLDGFAFSWGGFLRGLKPIGGSLAAALFVLLSCQRAGEVLRRFAGIPSPAGFALAAGLVLMGTTVLGFGLLGLLDPALLAGLTAALVLSGGLPKLKALPEEFPSLPVRLLVLAVMVPVVFTSLVPEVTYDALAYHVGAPEAYLKYRRIVRMEGMFFADLPGLIQMVYLPALSLGAGAGAAKMLHFLLGAASIGLAWRLGELVGGRKCADWAVLFLAATPFLWICMMKANVDLGVMFLVVAAVIQFASGSSLRRITAAGFFLGGAVAAKMTGVYALFAGLSFLGLWGQRRLPGRFAGIFLAAAAFPILGWFLKAFLMTGNPVYPFGSEVLGGLGWSAENSEIYRQDMTGPTSFNIQYSGIWDRIAGPWKMIMHDRGSEAALGVYVITLAPFVLLAGGVLSGLTGRIAWFCLVYWLIWFLTARDTRFFLPAWPIACVLCARVWTGFIEPGGKGRIFASSLFWLAAGLTPFIVSSLAMRIYNPGPVVWGAVERGMYVAKMIPPSGKFALMMRRASRSFRASERILLVGDVKAVDLRPIPVYPSLFDTPQIVSWTREAVSARRLAVRFRQKGITGVFFNPGGAVYLKAQFGHYRYTGSQYNILMEFWQRRLEPVHEMREKGVLDLGVYRLTAGRAARRDLKVPGESGREP